MKLGMIATHVLKPVNIDNGADRLHGIVHYGRAKMCKRIILTFLLLLIICMFSGCDEDYPSVVVHNDRAESSREISIGKPYKYIGFDLENTDGGKDLILHFEESEE